jgi:hypothetical protein
MDKFNSAAVHTANSDTNGLFHLESLGPGKYKAVALTGEDGKRAHELQFLHDRMQSVEAIDLDFGQTLNIELRVK